MVVSLGNSEVDMFLTDTAPIDLGGGNQEVDLLMMREFNSRYNLIDRAAMSTRSRIDPMHYPWTHHDPQLKRDRMKELGYLDPKRLRELKWIEDALH